MNLGTLLGRLELGDRLEDLLSASALEPSRPALLATPIEKPGSIPARIRALLRKARGELGAKEIAAGLEIAIHQVFNALSSMKDVQRSGTRCRYRYSLKVST